MFELLTGAPLFKTDINRNIVALEDKDRLASWTGLSAEELGFVLPLDKNMLHKSTAQNLLELCLMPNPNDRLQSMEEVLGHEYFSGTTKFPVLTSLQDTSEKRIFISAQFDDEEKARKAHKLYAELRNLGVNTYMVT